MKDFMLRPPLRRLKSNSRVEGISGASVRWSWECSGTRGEFRLGCVRAIGSRRDFRYGQATTKQRMHPETLMPLSETSEGVQNYGKMNFRTARVDFMPRDNS